MSFALFIRNRLNTLGREQRDLAAAAQVTESYISQLMTGKKRPPASERSDIYDRMDAFLELPAGKLAALAELERRDILQRTLAAPPQPLLASVRELMLRKCAPSKQRSIRTVFEREPFGALENLVIQKLLDVVKRVAREELGDETWLRRMARTNGRSYRQLRVTVLEFLEADVFNLSDDHCVAFLDPLIESWEIDLATFSMEIVLNRRLARGVSKTFAFVERELEPLDQEPGLHAFLEDSGLSGNATAEELEFLKALRFPRRRPTALYYYRELQNLRDPLHFHKPTAGAADT